LRRKHPSLAELEETAIRNWFGVIGLPLENPYPHNAQYTEGYEILSKLALRKAKDIAKRRYSIYQALWGEGV